MRAFRPLRKSALASKFATAALILALVAGCKPPSLPDSTSEGAQLYVNRCGNCHAPYNPHEMTASMWDTQVTMMELKIHQAGMPPLTSDERDAILEYLKRHAGTE
jgi:mono/diheme cytochrome c family protein